MQALAILANTHDDCAHLVDSRHRLRARAFKGGMDGNVEADDGRREGDAFDDLQPRNIVAIPSMSEVVGCVWDLIPARLLTPDPAMIKSLRFCVDTTLGEDRAGGSLSDATKRFGAPRPMGDTTAVAGSLPADRVSFVRVRPAGYGSAFGACRAQPE